MSGFFAIYSEAIAIAALVFYALAIISAIEATYKVRTSQGAIAWSISLLTFPIVALPLYLVLGRNRFDGYSDQRIQIAEQARQLFKHSNDHLQGHIVELGRDCTVFDSLLNLTSMPATRGNEVELLVDGEATFASIEQALKTAGSFILFQFYIISDDELGRKLANILLERVAAGVSVYVLFDEIGSRPFSKSKLRRKMSEGGIEVNPFNTTRGRRNRFQLNFRNHRKIVVVDGKQAWIGGHNVGVEYLGQDAHFGAWRDTHVKITGPAVLGAQITFATDWLWATEQMLSIPWPTEIAPAGDCEVMVFPSDPASEFEEAGLMYHQLIVDARKRIWIASPYFVPDRAIISALQLAAFRGVDVRILIPETVDVKMVGLANWAFFRELLPAGVRIYSYCEGFMHQKVLLMDDELAGVGTANFDNRSFRLNFEVTALIRNADFGYKVYQMLKTDMGRCKPLSLADVESKPLWFRLGMNIARLFSPVL